MTPTERVTPELRAFVAERAHFCCEYCLLPEWISAYRHEPDHIIPRQHGGETVADNLALACIRCNRRKGPNVGSFDPESGDLTAFFNPRTDSWNSHFQLRGALIQPLTPAARVTVNILGLNDDARVAERARLIKAGLLG